MATATARGFEDDGYSPREMRQGLDEAALHANNGVGPEEVVADPVPLETSIGGLALGVYQPAGQEGMAVATYRALQIPIMTGRLLVRKQMPVFVRSGQPAPSGPPIERRIFGQSH